MLMASRDYIGAVNWVKENADDPDIAKSTEKAKKAFAGTEIKGKQLGVIGLGAGLFTGFKNVGRLKMQSLIVLNCRQ